MKKVNYIFILLLFLGISNVLQGQELECNVTSDDADTKFMPHYGNNKVLEEVLKRTMPDVEIKNGKITGKSSSVFRIPIKVWRYRDDNGSNQALSLSDVYDLIDIVNQRFEDNGTGISFYLKCAVQTINSTQFNTIHDEAEYDLMKQTYYDDKALNWHLVRTSASPDFGAIATFPWKPFNFSFMAPFNGNLYIGGNPVETRIGTTIHEIGHTLGLLHTHEARDGIWNGEAGNCYQESVSRTRLQGVFCVSTAFKKKCEVNGDYLCTTAAAPNTDANSGIDMDSNCNYTGTGTDNWGDTWDPPTINYMSYLDVRTCRDELDSGQIGVMHSSIIFYAHDGNFPVFGEPWYNKDVVSLAGTVVNGQNEDIYAPVAILVAEGSNTYTVNPGGDVLLRAQEYIEMFPGFEAQQGSSFEAITVPNADCGLSFAFAEEDKQVKVYNEVYDMLVDALQNQEKILSQPDRMEHIPTINVYPNPNHGIFRIESDQKMISWELRNQLGNVSIISRNNTIGFTTDSLDISRYASGVYFLKVTLENGQIVTKTVVKE
ncbi:MAG: zinc-dependent metalloprotease [Flavobacteriaceae bacterium]|nr:zinc-dependent metalloprotease [Flavobacteriaceae bacterium]